MAVQRRSATAGKHDRPVSSGHPVPPTRVDLANALQRVLDHGMKLTGASNHGVSEALYLRDPDDNGVELYRDRPRSEWPKDSNGELIFTTKPLKVDDLLAERW